MTIRELADKAADLIAQVAEVKAQRKEIFDSHVKPLDEKAKGISSQVDNIKAEIAPLALAHYAETKEKTIGGIVVKEAKDPVLVVEDWELALAYLSTNAPSFVETKWVMSVKPEYMDAVSGLLAAIAGTPEGEGIARMEKLPPTVTFPTNEKGWRK